MQAAAPRLDQHAIPQGQFSADIVRAAQDLWIHAPEHDHDAADPTELCQPLTTHGLFVAALPVTHGGAGLATDGAALSLLVEALQAIGGADLSAGRIFEGHVNAVKLVFRYGDLAQQAALASDVRAGAVCGVWNAEAPPGLRLDATPASGRPGLLMGGKIYASGLGLVTRPLFTARTAEGRMLMLAPRLKPDQAYDVSAWRVRGMRATATGTIDFTGMPVDSSDVVGAADDYYRAPSFKGGAWRFAAVQAGATSRLAVLMREELRVRRRTDDPHQKARVGTAALAAETSRLWVAQAATIAEDPASDPAAADAYVNLARLAVERSALEVIALAERGLGLSAFTRPSPVERVVRDLSTYLRQPFPDGALEDAAAYLLARDGAPPWDQRVDGQ
jgi:alkylation response protein AidB-like acyl-CoA dehydrogenase